MKYLFTLFTLLCTASTILHAQQPGTLDKTFGDGGIVISTTSEGDGKDLLVQKDGKIISISRGTYGNLAGGFLLLRYNTDGTPDLTFGDSGRVATNPYSGGSYGAFAALQEDGKIIAGGGKGASPAIIRYNTDGTVDSSFGINGVAIQQLKSDYANPTGLAIQPDGKILISGTDWANGEIHDFFYAIYIIRYNTDGTLDASFGNGGIMEQQVFDAIATAGIAVQPDGNILVGGNPCFVRRYTADGTPDTKFGINGKAEYNFASTKGSTIYAIALRADGSIVVAGSRYGVRSDDNPQAILVGFTAEGKVDNEFGKGGVVTTQVGKHGSEIYDLALQPDGKIVAAASIIDFNNPEASLAYAALRYLGNGALDSSFGQDGYQVTSMQYAPYASAVALQPDGKIVLGGYSLDDAYYFRVSLVRYNGDNNKQSPIVRIKRWLQHHGISWQGVQSGNNIRYYTVQRSADGIVYKDIAKVSSKVNNYEDAAMPAADSYYRIAATGWDGRRTYSNTILIDDAQQARIFPNPVKDNLQLQGLPANGKTNVSVVDLNGNVRSSATATGTNYSVNTANLSSGSYLLKIQHGGIATTLPFVKE